jgi:uncharacterized protein (DUF2252 family)
VNNLQTVPKASQSQPAVLAAAPTSVHAEDTRTESVAVHLSPAERLAHGHAARQTVPRTHHAEWTPAPRRRDPVTLLEEQNRGRVAWLVPIRNGRMRVSPFAFYRGAARIMAADLAATPSSGLLVQACGDAHLANFGVYASPERQLAFDVNDFDETLPGPWEWDVKRLAASCMIAGLHRRFDRATCESVTARAVEGYCTGMTEAAGMGTLDVWYDHLTADQLREVAEWSQRTMRRQVSRLAQHARSSDNLQALRRLAVQEAGHSRIRSDPPLLLPLREIPEFGDPAEVEATVRTAFTSYKQSIGDDRRVVLDRFRPVDVALKVVGVGSVGTRCFILLLEGRDRGDPLFLQVKEAAESVLEEHLAPSRYKNHGQRVVEGPRLTQAVSDILLGWTRDPAGPDYYVRQLRDWKGSVDLEHLAPNEAAGYAFLCGWTLARGHARSGDAVAIAAYIGRSDVLVRAITAFAAAYAHQNDEDYAAFVAAIEQGRLEATTGR